MNISDRIMILLRTTGKKQIDLLPVLNMASRASLGNKFSLCRWSAADLIKVADFVGARLVFQLPDGETVPLKISDIQEATTDN